MRNIRKSSTLESKFPLLAVEQFARIINDSGYISLRRLTDEEITGTERTTGLVGKYLSLSTENVQCLEDMELSASGMRIGNKHLCLHTLSQTEDLPTEVSTDNRFERLSTDRSDCRLSFAAPVGLLLSCNHIYNQYVFIDNSDEILQKFEMTSSSPRSRQSMSCFHSGRVFSWLALSSMIRQQPYFSIQARSKVNVSYCSELNM